ncbi:VP10 [Lishui pangolin virus]|nr:VP10 [Lishui pangolin virus]
MEPSYYSVFLLPTGRRLAKKLHIIENFRPLPKDLWDCATRVEAKLKYAIERYPADWRARLAHHEKNGTRVRLQVPRGVVCGEVEELCRRHLREKGINIDKVQFCSPSEYKGRRRPGRVLICLDNGTVEGEGVSVDFRRDDFEWVGTLAALVGSRLRAWDFIQPGRGCRYNFRNFYHKGEIPEWLINAQEQWHLEYGVSRSLAVGASDDFFADYGVLGAVRSWPGCQRIGSTEFKGEVLYLPECLLTVDEVRLQRGLLSKHGCRRVSQIQSRFCFVTVQPVGLLDAESRFYLRSAARGFTFIVPSDKRLSLGPQSCAAMKEMLTFVLGSVDRESRVAMTLFSAKKWERDFRVMSTSPCVSYHDGMDVFLLKEVLGQPPRLIFLGRKGCGKSRLAGHFSRLGYNILDSDTYGRVLNDCTEDMDEAGRVEVFRKYLRLTKEERDAKSSWFEVKMKGVLEDFKGVGLKSYLTLGERENCGSLHIDVYRVFSELYNKKIREWTPFDFQKTFIELITAGDGFDDLGVGCQNSHKTVCFVHSFPELMQAMSSVLGELVPAHDTRVAIALRGQGLDTSTELHLHDFYVSLNQQGVRKVGIGWLIHELEGLGTEAE